MADQELGCDEGGMLWVRRTGQGLPASQWISQVLEEVKRVTQREVSARPSRCSISEVWPPRDVKKTASDEVIWRCERYRGRGVMKFLENLRLHPLEKSSALAKGCPPGIAQR